MRLFRSNRALLQLANHFSRLWHRRFPVGDRLFCGGIYNAQATGQIRSVPQERGEEL